MEFEQAESELRRVAGLFEKGYISRNDYETAEYARDAAKASLELAGADLKSAEALLEVARENLRKTIIRSPVDGIVLRRDVEEGQTVSASLQAPTLLTVGDLGQMQINATVDEADIGRVRVGQEVRFYVDSYPERVFTGQVAKIYYSPTIEQNVVTEGVAEDTAGNGKKKRGKKGEGTSKEVVNLWRDVSSSDISNGQWDVYAAYQNKVQNRVIEILKKQSKLNA